MLGVDGMDTLKGISPKLFRFELFHDRNPNIRGKVVLVQIVNWQEQWKIEEAIKVVVDYKCHPY